MVGARHLVGVGQEKCAAGWQHFRHLLGAAAVSNSLVPPQSTALLSFARPSVHRFVCKAMVKQRKHCLKGLVLAKKSALPGEAKKHQDGYTG